MLSLLLLLVVVVVVVVVVVCDMCTVCYGLFALPFGVTGRLCSVIVVLRGYLLSILSFNEWSTCVMWLFFKSV